MKCGRNVIATIAALGGLSSSAVADELVIDSANRSVTGIASVNPPGSPVVSNVDGATANGLESFDVTLPVLTSLDVEKQIVTAQVITAQTSSVAATRLAAAGSAINVIDASQGAGGSAEGISFYSVTFTVAEPIDVLLSGTAIAGPVQTFAHARVNVLLFSVGGPSVFHANTMNLPPETPLELDEVLSLPPGQYNFQIFCDVFLDDGATLGLIEPEATLDAHFDIELSVLPLIGDLDQDGEVNAADLAMLLGAWGACEGASSCAADLTGDGDINAADLALLLGNWG